MIVILNWLIPPKGYQCPDMATSRHLEIIVVISVPCARHHEPFTSRMRHMSASSSLWFSLPRYNVTDLKGGGEGGLGNVCSPSVAGVASPPYTGRCRNSDLVFGLVGD